LKALITGISGQDAAFLAHNLLKENFEVFGVTRKLRNNFNNLQLLGIKEKVQIFECDLTNIDGFKNDFDKIGPDIIFNLSGQSSVGQSHLEVRETIISNTLPVLNMLEYIRLHNMNIRFYQACSSEIYGNTEELPINLKSETKPNSPYGLSKNMALDLVRYYRSSYQIFACAGILFNHESFLRDDRFFIKKVIKESFKIKSGESSFIKLGNLQIERDFGSAQEYMEAVIKIATFSEPREFIICSGKVTKLQDIVKYIISKLDLSMDVVISTSENLRSNEIMVNYGDNTESLNLLKWAPERDIFDIVDEMISFENKNQLR
jgi:GDPmannose 4,6-dehydratase